MSPVNQLQEYLQNTPKEELMKDWEEVEAMGLEGPTLSQVLSMNQVPEIKEGLQFTHRGDGHSIVYTLGKGNPEQGWEIKFRDPKGKKDTNHFSQDLIEYGFQQGMYKTLVPLTTLFSTLPENVVMTALEECAKDYWKDGIYPQGFDGPLPAFLEWHTSAPEELTKQLVDKIHALGYQILPK